MAHRVEGIAGAIAVLSSIKLQHDRTQRWQRADIPSNCMLKTLSRQSSTFLYIYNMGSRELHDLHEQGKHRSSVERYEFIDTLHY